VIRGTTADRRGWCLTNRKMENENFIFKQLLYKDAIYRKGAFKIVAFFFPHPFKFPSLPRGAGRCRGESGATILNAPYRKIMQSLFFGYLQLQ
jgi:hypothetical protein